MLPAVALAATLTPRPISAAISSQLCDKTASVATQFAAGRAAASAGSVFATTLAREVLKSMLLAQRNLLVIGCLFLGAIAVGSGFVGPAEGRQAGKADLRHGTPKADDAALKPGPGRMFVVGRVLNPTGTPVPGASRLWLASRSDGPGVATGSTGGRQIVRRVGGQRWPRPASGWMQFARRAPGTTRSVPFARSRYRLAAGWVELDPDAGQPAGDITLRPEQVIQGRLFDVHGRPAQGVEVSVESMQTTVAGSPAILTCDAVGPYFFRVKPGDLPAWPNPAKSDADGRFTIRGAGRSIRVGLALDHPKFARQRTHVDTDQFSDTKNVTMAVEPARIITGRVTYADSGKPAPHAVVDISIQGDDGSSFWAGDFITDADGRFRANPGSAHRYLLSSFPPEREPYLNVGKNLDWPRGAIEHSLDLVLPRGILVRGRVIEDVSGKPIVGARIGYLSNPDRDPQSGAWNTRAVSVTGRVVPARRDARSGLSHPPGARRGLRAPGDWPANGSGGQTGRAPHLCPRLPQARFETRLQRGRPGSRHPVRSGRAALHVTGRVVGPDGQPVRNALVINRVSACSQAGLPGYTGRRPTAIR